MSPTHRHAVAVILVVAGVALSACAQRGAMGRSGGVGSHGAQAFRGTPAPAGRSGPMFQQQFGASSNQRFAGQPAPGHAGRGWGDNRDNREDRYRRSYRPFYGFGLPYGGFGLPYGGGWYGPSYLDYPATGYDYPGAGYDSAYSASQPPPDPRPNNYSAPPYSAPPVEQPAAPSASDYRPPYQRTQAQYDPDPEDPVTLVFKDGRPTEQIQNYMITRTTLYVQGRHLREIPVEQLDVAATQKLNQDAGVEFQLPVSR